MRNKNQYGILVQLAKIYYMYLIYKPTCFPISLWVHDDKFRAKFANPTAF